MNKLTNDQITDIWEAMPGEWLKEFGYIQFAQAIEEKVTERLCAQAAAAVLTDEKWTPKEQAAFSAWAIREFPNESSQGLISLGSAFKRGQAFALAHAGKAEAPAAAGIEGLMRYKRGRDGEMWIHGGGEYVKFADVERLLAHEIAWRDTTIVDLSGKLSVAESNRAHAPAPAKLTDAHIAAFAAEWSKYVGHYEFERNDFYGMIRAIEREVLGAHAGVVAAEPAAWMHEDGRVVTAATMSGTRKDGGAILSSLRGYTIPLYAAPAAQAPVPNAEEVRLSAVREARIADLEGQLAECAALSQKWAAAAGEADGRAEKSRNEALEEARTIPVPLDTVDGDDELFVEGINYGITKYRVALGALASKEAAAAEAPSDIERDAARYRWLREKRDIPHGTRNIPWVVALDPAEKVHTMVLRAGVELDAAVDVAMAASKEGGTE